MATVRQRRRGPAAIRKCVSNFYPLTCTRPRPGGQLVYLSLFRCHYFETDPEVKLQPRQETELKRHIFDALRNDDRWRYIRDYLGLQCFEFGGDSAGGLSEDDPRRRGGVARPQHVREVNRNETMRVPPGEALRIGAGESLKVQGRGPERGEAAGRVELGRGSWIECDPDAELENEGTLSIEVEVEQKQGHPAKFFRMEIEQSNVFIVHMLEDGGWLVDGEEQAIALQCFTWLLHGAFRTMQYRTLGGRGWYPTRGPDARLPFPNRQGSYHHQRTRAAQVSPRLYLYRGWAPNLVSVARGPHLKIDLSIRLVQAETALQKINLLREAYRRQFTSRQRAGPSVQEEEAFLNRHLAGRTCITDYNHMSYKIARVCLDKSVNDEFGSIGKLVDYFWDTWWVNLEENPGQPLLHCPKRRLPELYLPAQVAHLTGKDEDWKSDVGFSQELQKELSMMPDKHWEHQAQLLRGLRDPDQGGQRLQQCGLTVSSEPLEVRCHQAECEPVYYSFEADAAFRGSREPAPRLRIGTSPEGFERRPWPDIWTEPTSVVDVEHWVIVCGEAESDWLPMETFVRELSALRQELISHNRPRVRFGEPAIVKVPEHEGTVEQWRARLANCELPWPLDQTAAMLVVIPDWLKSRDPDAYYKFKNEVTFGQAVGLPSQMVLSSTVRKGGNSRQQVLRNILQQILVKCGAWPWVFSPLSVPRGRVVMVAGIEARRGTSSTRSIQVVCASTNRYFTSYYNSWSARDGVARSGVDYESPPGELLCEAVVNFFEVNRKLPHDLVIYRAGVSQSQETALMNSEVQDVRDDRLRDLVVRALDGKASPGVLEQWGRDFRLAYILVRRNTDARFRTEDYNNVPSGTFVTEGVVTRETAEDALGEQVAERFEFYLVAQNCPGRIGTARPSHCSVLYTTLGMSRRDLVQLTFRLCGLYMVFPGRVALPAPLRYANKLLGLLTKCEGVPDRPRGQQSRCKSLLFFV